MASTGTVSTFWRFSPTMSMLAVMPVRSSAPWRSIAISTSKTLTFSSSRAAGAMRRIVPANFTFG